MNWYLAVLKNYVGFSGRARRKELWMFVLFNLIVSIVIGIIDGIAGTMTTVDAGGIPVQVGIIGIVYSLAVLLPGIAVGVRRLHDTNRSGWWLLIWFIPVIGWLVLLVFYILEGTRGSNRFGADPKLDDGYGDAAAV